MAHKNSYTVLRKVHIGNPIWVIVMMHVCVYIFTHICLTTNCMHMIWKSRWNMIYKNHNNESKLIAIKFSKKIIRNPTKK